MPHSKRTRQKLDAELAVHLRKGRVHRAAAVLTEIVEKDRDDDRLFVRLAELRLKLGDEAGARAAFRGAAEAAEKRGFYLRAMAALRQEARTLAPHERPWLELSRLAIRLGLLADALGFLDEGVRAWEGSGDRTRTLVALRRCHELAPDDVRRSLRLAHELRSAGFVLDAVSLLRQDAGRHRQAGREEAWLSLGRDLAALAPSPELCREVAGTLLDRGEPRGALKLLRPYLDGPGRDAGAVALAARAVEELGKPVRPPLPEAPPVLAATPVPGRLPVVSPPRPTAPTAARPAAVAVPGPAAPGPAPELPPLLVPVSAPAPAAAPAPQPLPLLEPQPPPEPVEPPAAPAMPPAAMAEAEEEELVDLAGAGVSMEDEAPAWVPDQDHRPDLDFDRDLDDEIVHLVDALAEDEPPPIPPDQVADELAHAAFLVAHGFEDEARQLLDALAAAHPDHPGVVELLVRMAAGHDRRPARAPLLARPASGAGASLAGQPAAGLAGPPAELEFASAEAVLESFRQGVAATVGSDDWAARFDLGVAYREMGLFSDALAEFETALLSAPGARAVDCLIGVAQSHAGRGHHAEAARALERALGVTPLPAQAAAAVNYELGLVRQSRGDAAAAARAFEQAERALPGFRDARRLAERLRGGEATGARDGPFADLAADPAGG